MNRQALIYSYLSLVLLISGCYPLSVTRWKWRIKYDKNAISSKNSFLSNTEAKSTDKPNVILIIVDDLGKYEVSAYGSETMQTPNIDQIGKEGVVFEQAYVTAPTCAPSRAGIITGRVQNRYGFETQIMEFYPTNMVEYLSGKYFVNTGDFEVAAKPQFPSEWQVIKQGVPPSEINLAEIMKSQGYKTAQIGKWHLGVSKNHLPLNRGFDYQYGFYGASSLYAPERNWSHVMNYEYQSFST